MIFFIPAVIIFCDQLTKYFAVKYLSLGQPVPLLAPIVYLTLVFNRGAAFGMLRNQTPFFIAVSLAAIIVIITTLQKSTFLQRSPLV